MKFATYEESRIDAIKTASIMFGETFEASATRIDQAVSKIRNECVRNGTLNNTCYIRGTDYKFKIDANYLTFD